MPAFFFGFPHPDDVKAHRAKHMLWSLALLFIDFSLQLAAILAVGEAIDFGKPQSPIQVTAS